MLELVDEEESNGADMAFKSIPTEAPYDCASPSPERRRVEESTGADIALESIPREGPYDYASPEAR